LKNNIFVQISDEYHAIENIENKNNLKATESHIELVLEKIPSDQLIFIVNKDTYDIFKDFKTIGANKNCDIVLIDDENIKFFIGKKLKNVYLFVEDESNLLSNFELIYKNVKGFIDFKMKDLSLYNLDILKDQLEKISDILYELDKTDSDLIVKQLNGYRIKNKFQEFGETDLFAGPDGNIYLHPSFYYQKESAGIVCKIEDLKIDEMTFHFTYPHLICIICNCFYCDRNIYLNKIRTNEFKVPCINSCATTTLFSNLSKKLFNKLMNEEKFKEENLDQVEKYNSEDAYEKYLTGSVPTNYIKNIDYLEKKLWKK
jgi:hypothetical protein